MMANCNCKPFNTNFDFLHKQEKKVTCSDKGSSTIKYIYENQSSDYLSNLQKQSRVMTEINP
jgi:hypothetical protein